MIIASSSASRRESGKMEARRESAKGARKKNLDGLFPRGERAAPAGRLVCRLVGRPDGRRLPPPEEFVFLLWAHRPARSASKREREREESEERPARVSAQMFNGLSNKSSIIRCEMMNPEAIAERRTQPPSFSASLCRGA